jgi:hypothetical protein
MLPKYQEGQRRLSTDIPVRLRRNLDKFLRSFTGQPVLTKRSRTMVLAKVCLPVGRKKMASSKQKIFSW